MRIVIRLLVLLCAIALAAAAPPPPPSTPSAALNPNYWQWAQTPPMGWNSWDCFGTAVTEEQTLANADYMDKNLKAHGWNIVTVDIQWYEPLARGLSYRRNAILEMDANGRLLPAPNRFPSSKDSQSFKPLADALHAKGLKFGLHLLRGIPRQAVTQNTPVLGTSFHAADIANTHDICSWNGDMYGVDMTKPGAQDYYDSVFQQLADWQIDLVKVDDLSRPYHTAEIEAIRKAIDKAGMKTGRPIVFSTSPGATPLSQGAHVQQNANMWRVSDDFWDDWQPLKDQFKRLHDWEPFRGPGHFPDADMIPIGNVRAFQSTDNWTHFTHDEQISLMTLWCIARSPLILGGNLPKNDDFTLQLLTNDEVLNVNQHSDHNRELRHDGDQYIWVADGNGKKYLAFFNAPDAPPGQRGRNNRARAATQPALNPAATQPSTISLKLADLDLGNQEVINVRDLWNHRDMGKTAAISATLAPHAAALFEIQFAK